MTRTLRVLGRAALAGFTAACCIALALHQHQAISVCAQQGFSVNAMFNSRTPVTPRTPISLQLSLLLRPDEGTLAITIGRTDVTSLFIADNTRLVYSPTLVPLPLGQSNVVCYVVNAEGVWHEVAQFELRVANEINVASASEASAIEGDPENLVSTATESAAPVVNAESLKKTSPTVPATHPPKTSTNGRVWGFEKLSYLPSLNLAIKSQPAQSNLPESIRPTQRATFTDGTLQFSMRNEIARDWFRAQTRADFAGSTFQQEALRFGTLRNEAPKIDLSSYVIQMQIGPAKVAIGHTSFGSSRHLINNFSSRGITATVPITKRFDFSVGALNGTSVVGFGNLFGLAKTRHQLQSATLGVELWPKRAGALRLEFSGINAYFQALNSFTQGNVNDVERSKGGSVRLIAADASGRFRFEAGFARSRYNNPADPLLYQGTNTVPIPFLTRNARYFEVNVDVLRGYSLTKTRHVNLSVSMRHERVDPLFKSLGASAQPDKQQNDFQLSSSIGEISIQASHGRFNDNLKLVPSILKSLTRSTQFSLALPTAALWGGTSSTSKYLPRISYSLFETNQFGIAIPVNGGFETDQSSVPDQVSTNQTLSADWQIKSVSVGYSYNRSFTDNRQPGRAFSDFLNQTSGARVGFNPLPKLSLNFDLTRDSANDVESARLLRTWRVGSTATWTIGNHITWTAGIANTIASDRGQINGSRNTEFDTQFSYRLGMDRGELKKIQTQMFIRYADRYARSHDFVFQTFNRTRVKIMNAGLNITFF